jgi:hypothetical protein
MLNRKARQERGQAILLMAVALVGMLGFAAVALDGGNIYAEQRRAQSAADNAVLAAAYQYMKGITVTSTISNSALSNAVSNEYDNNSTSNWVRFYRPPITGAYTGNSSYMQVVITERVPTALAHLVYQGPFLLTVSAIAYANTGGAPVSGNAIVALDPTGCGTIVANGGTGNAPTLGIHTTGGGIFANSDGSLCTGSGRVMDTKGTNAEIVSDPPYGNSVVASTKGFDNKVSPEPTAGTAPISTDPLGDLNPPVCASGPGTSPSSGTIDPGTYDQLNLSTGSTLTLNPGLYCIVHSGNNAVSTAPGSTLSGMGVTLYVPYGEVNLQQGAVTLKAPSTTRNPECLNVFPDQAPDSSVCHYIGLVFFMGRTNTLGLTLNGQADWNVEGTIYAINSAVTLTGNGDWGLTGQILSKNLVASGNGTILVNFDPTLVYSPAPAISLMQ